MLKICTFFKKQNSKLFLDMIPTFRFLSFGHKKERINVYQNYDTYMKNNFIQNFPQIINKGTPLPSPEFLRKLSNFLD